MAKGLSMTHAILIQLLPWQKLTNQELREGLRHIKHLWNGNDSQKCQGVEQLQIEWIP